MKEKSEVEPLLAGLKGAEDPKPGPGLGWRILWAALVLAGLLALVLKQAF